MKKGEMYDSIDSFKQYYNETVSSLVFFARRFVLPEIAEDIVHDVFLEVWDHWEMYEEVPARSFLYMAVRNRCLNYLKREQVKDHYIRSEQLDSHILGLDYYNSSEKFVIDKEDIRHTENL